jgi:mannose-6-phosphate isomerase-like protein (cupin superfamily)
MLAMERPFSVFRREAREVTETPFGSVGVLHAGDELRAWWIWKDRESGDPEWTVLSRDDFLYVVAGCLRLEVRDGPDFELVARDSVVIPAGTAFRGFRWPRDSEEACVFAAVSSADMETRKEPVG